MALGGSATAANPPVKAVLIINAGHAGNTYPNPGAAIELELLSPVMFADSLKPLLQLQGHGTAQIDQVRFHRHLFHASIDFHSAC